MSVIRTSIANGQDVAELDVDVKWDEKSLSQKIDVDFAAALFDHRGVLLDLACFNQTSVANGSVVMSGDKRDGSQKGVDEFIKVFVDKLPPTVIFVLFVVTIASENASLSDMKKFSLNVHQMGQKKNFLESKDKSAKSFVPFGLVRQPNRFDFIDIEHSSSQHGLENIWPMCDQVLQKLVPPLLWSQRPAILNYRNLKLQKGQEILLPQSDDTITVGVGWDTQTNGTGNIDLDCWCYLFENNNGHFKLSETIFFNNKVSNDRAIRLGGDNRTGQGKGDDEKVEMRLKDVSNKISAIAVVVKIYTKHTFSQVDNEYVRMVRSNGEEILRYAIDYDEAFKSKNCGIFCILRRVGHSWRFEPMGIPANNDSKFEQNLPEFIVKTFK